MPLTVRILVAKSSPDDALPLRRTIKHELEDQMDGIEIHVDVVTTLADALALAQEANATILDLNLDDAGPDEVLAAMADGKFKSPIIVMTSDPSPEIHSRCRKNGASVVLEKGSTRDAALCAAILRCLTKDVIEIARSLPQ